MSNITKKILVVDDERVIRDMMADIMDLEGYTIELARNGREALDIVQEADNNAHYLIFLDLMMPVMDGKEFCERLNQDSSLRQKQVIIAMSALDLLKNSTTLHVDGIMPKPFVVDDVLEIIQKYVS